jgi:hypothetical protein
VARGAAERPVGGEAEASARRREEGDGGAAVSRGAAAESSCRAAAHIGVRAQSERARRKFRGPLHSR